MSIFEDQFWGDKNSGYDVLTTALTYGKDSSRELSEFLKQRAVLEELYSKGLHKISKAASGHSENGSFYPLWKVLGDEVEKESQTHSEMCKKLTELSNQVAAYCQVQEKKYNTALEALAPTCEAVKSINRLTEDVYKCEEKYISKCFEREKLAKTSTKASGKDVEKAEIVVRKSMEEYRSVIEKYGKSKDVFIEKFSSATDKFQELESSHLEGMKEYLDQYIDVIEEGLSYDYQATIEFKDSQRQWTIRDLLTDFVQRKRTGEEKPGEIEQVVFDGNVMPKNDSCRNSKPVENDEYYKEMIAKIVPPPPPDDQLLINQKDPKNVKGFLKRMKKERKKKKQRNSSTASSDSASVKSPNPSYNSTSGPYSGAAAGGGDFDDNAPTFNRNVSVDSEGYSLKPVELPSSHNRDSTNSFYSSSEDESDDDNNRLSHSMSSSIGGGGSTQGLKFSIRPPDINVAPSMEDLSSSARGLTLERSPRMNRRQMAATSSASSVGNNLATPEGQLKNSTDYNNYDSTTSQNYTQSNIQDTYSTTYGDSQSNYDPYGRTSDPSTANYSSSYSSFMTETVGDSNTYYNYSTPASYDNSNNIYNPNGYDETVVPSYSTQGSDGYDTNYNTYSSYSNYDTQMKADMYDYSDKPQMGPNSSDEEEEDSELPPPSMPPPRLPQNSTTTMVVSSNPPPPRPEAPCPSNAFRIANQQSETSSVDYCSQKAAGQYNSSPLVGPQTTEVVQTLARNASEVLKATAAVDTEFASFTRDSGAGVGSSSSSAAGGIGAGAVSFSNTPMTSSRGPSPLNMGTTEAVPIAVLFLETVHAVVNSQLPPSQWQVTIQGTMSISFPAGIIQAFSSGRFIDQLKFSILNSALLSRVNANENIVEPPADGDLFGSHVEYCLEMNKLAEELKRQHADNPLSNFYNVDILKYQINVDSYQENYLPLLLSTDLQSSTSQSSSTDEGTTFRRSAMTSSSSDEEEPTNQNCRSLSVQYCYNQSCTLTHSAVVAAKPLLNVNVLAKLLNYEALAATALQSAHHNSVTADNFEVKSVDPKPVINECGKLVWKIGAVSINSNCPPINVKWVSPSPLATSIGDAQDMSMDSGPVIAAQFSCEGALLSGLEFDLHSPGYRLSLYKKKVQTGKYLCHC